MRVEPTTNSPAPRRPGRGSADATPIQREGAEHLTGDELIRAQQALDAMAEGATELMDAQAEIATETVDAQVEIPTQVVEQEQQREQAKQERNRFASMILGVKKRYSRFKKSLLERTDATLEAVADEYVERYEGARDPRTGEVPSTYFARIDRAMQSVRSSVTVGAAVDLG